MHKQERLEVLHADTVTGYISGLSTLMIDGYYSCYIKKAKKMLTEA